ncbi:MAG TPA: glycosyltransferase WbuB [Campylobacterales bacterium]|nr:glycosyltransferase WbuB [Campylobacterales bacterium]
MDKKNIWIINQYTGSSYYGMNFRSYYFAKEFVASGHEVTIFTGSYSHLFFNYPKTDGMFTKESIDSINYIWVKVPKYKSSKSMGRVVNMFVFTMKLLLFNIFKIKKPDIIIISSLSLFPVLNAYIWSKLLKVEFIFEVRDIWPLTLMQLGGMAKYHLLVIILGWFEKLGYKNAKKVVSVLPYAKEHMISHGMQENKFVAIPNGIFLDEVQEYEDSDIMQHFPKDKFIVGYVGTIGIANAMEYLFEVAKLLQDNSYIHFVIVGKGGELNRSKKYCFEHKLSNVTFIPPVAKNKVQGTLSLFDICYLGWHKKDIYNHGVSANKIFDYMYSAKPILHSISVQNDIVKKAQCGICVEAEDILEIKKAILHLLSLSKDNLAKMGNNGKKFVIKNHSYKTLSKRYMEIL